MNIIAIDPGKHMGWAIAHEGMIIAAGTVTDRTALPAAPIAIIEMPRVYPNPLKWRGNPQHVVQTAALAGAVATQYRCHLMVEPRRWRGTAPESVLRARIVRALRDEEKIALPTRASEHAWDAIGMLLWVYGRL